MIARPLSLQDIADKRKDCHDVYDKLSIDRACIVEVLANPEKSTTQRALTNELWQSYLRIITRPERLIHNQDEEIVYQGILEKLDVAEQEGNSNDYSLAFVAALLFAPLSSCSLLRLDLLTPFGWKALDPACCVNASYVLDDIETSHNSIDFYADLFKKLQTPDLNQLYVSRVRASILTYFRSVELTSSSTNLIHLRGSYGELGRAHLQQLGYVLDWKQPVQSSKDKRIHLAVLSSYLDTHGHGFPAFSPLFSGLDRTQFKKTLICLPSKIADGWLDKTRPMIDTVFDQICIVDDQEKESIDKIRDLNIDILYSVDPYDTTLMGTPAELAYYRLARHQITGYFNNATTGIPTMDAIITSSQLDDPNIARTHFTEHVEYMKPLPFCYDFDSYFAVKPEKITHEDLGLPLGAKVLTSGNTFMVKLRKEAFMAYLQILMEVDNSYLVLMHGGSFYHQENIFWHRFEDCLKEAGIDPSRIVFVPNSTRERQFGLIELADVYLDFFPFSGANSILDPLYLGTPPVVLNSTYQLRCRQATAFLEALDCQELSTRTIKEYIDLAKRLLTDKSFAATFVNKMGDEKLRLSPLFNKTHPIQAFEKALCNIYTS